MSVQYILLTQILFFNNAIITLALHFKKTKGVKMYVDTFARFFKNIFIELARVNIHMYIHPCIHVYIHIYFLLFIS